MAVRDTDVEVRGSALAGRHVVLGVSGGIAAVDTVRIARELRRQGAEITVIMTSAAQRIITPLAVRWATQGEVITDWDGDMEAPTRLMECLLFQRHETPWPPPFMASKMDRY